MSAGGCGAGAGAVLTILITVRCTSSLKVGAIGSPPSPDVAAASSAGGAIAAPRQ
jgi:hypothetical protein